MTFYNTTELSGEMLERKKEKAKSQEELILKFFEKNPSQVYSAWDLQFTIIELRKTPITSIRRALSNLSNKKDGMFSPLVKTATKKPGPFGDVCFCFQLNVPTDLFN